MLRKMLLRSGKLVERNKIMSSIKSRKRNPKKAVAIAKENDYEDLYQKLDSREGTDMIYKLAKTRNRRTKDIIDNIYINDADGNILTDHE